MVAWRPKYLAAKYLRAHVQRTSTKSFLQSLKLAGPQNSLNDILPKLTFKTKRQLYDCSFQLREKHANNFENQGYFYFDQIDFLAFCGTPSLRFRFQEPKIGNQLKVLHISHLTSDVIQ